MISTNGLVSYWTLDENSGTRYDSVGHNDLTSNNGVAGSSNGIGGNSAQFVAALSRYLSCPSNESLQMAGNKSFTIACWANITSQPGGAVAYGLVTKDVDTPASSRDYFLFYSNGQFGKTGFTFQFQGGTTFEVSTGVTTTLGLWNFVVAWYDSSNGQLHMSINNATPLNSVNTGSTGTDVSGAEFRIGGHAYTGFPDYADARIDEVSLWKRLLTTSEISELYNNGLGLPYAFSAMKYRSHDATGAG